MSPPVVGIRVVPELRFFLAPRHRSGALEVRYDGTSTVGHIVESVGVPLPEVGALTVDGRRVGPGGRPRPGDVVTVATVRRPQPLPVDPPRFVLDVHLGALARRLRLLGVDTAYRNDATDDELVVQVAAEDRLLLTQDRGLLRRRALRSGAYVRGARPDAQLGDVLDRFALTPVPFTRCTACNGELAPVPKADVADRLEPGTRRSFDVFSRCRDCGRVYWRGAHARRLDAVVAATATGAAARDEPTR